MKKPLTRIFLFLLLCVCAVFGTCKFDYDLRADGFVPVESIIGVPTGGVKGYKITLNRSVYPSTATNKTIEWSIEEDGGTGSVLDRNKLTATSAGTVTVRALIKDGKARGVDYAQEFEITIHEGYIAVNLIQGIPAKIQVGTIALEGTVKPNNAVNTTIIWELKSAGPTGATLDGNVLTTTAMGPLTVTAVVESGAGPDTDFRQDFMIMVSPFPVTSIAGVATGCVVGSYTLSGKVNPSNASFKDISWEVTEARSTGAVINGDVLTTTSSGIVIVRAIVKNGVDFDYDYIQDFEIQIDDTLVPVTSITGLPIGCIPGDYTLRARTDPDTATNKTIIWEVKSAGQTGAVIDNGNVLTTTAPGTVTITATVKDGTASDIDYTQDFDIRISTPVIYIVADNYDTGYDYWIAYWKNGVRTDLPTPEGTSSALILGIAEEGGKIYILGSYLLSDEWKHCYWKLENDNVAFSDLSIDYDTSILDYQFTVSNGVLHWAWVSYNSNNGAYYNTEDKTTVSLEIPPTSTRIGGGSGIAVKGKDVYISGYYSTTTNYPNIDTPCYWDKDGKCNDLPSTAGYSSGITSGITVHNGSVYIGGYQVLSPPYILCYWKDGDRVDVVFDTYFYSYIDSVYFTVEDDKIIMASHTGGRWWIYDGNSTIPGVVYSSLNQDELFYIAQPIIYEGAIHSVGLIDNQLCHLVNWEKVQALGSTGGNPLRTKIIAVRE
jgi:hypothetical protein